MVWIRRSAYFVSALVALAALFLTVFSLVNLYQHRLLKPVLTLSASTPNATHRPFYFWRDRNTLILNPNNGPPLFQTVNTVTGESATLDILTKTISGEISWLFASPDGQSIYWSIPRYGPNGFLLSSELHQMALDGSGHSIALLPPDSDAIPLQDMTTGIYSIRSSQAGGIRPITFVPTGNAPQRTPDSDVFFAGIPGGLSRRPWILGEVQNGAVTDGTGVDVFANDQARRGNYNIGPGWAHLSFPQYPGAASTPAEVSLLKLPDLRTASPAPAHRSVVTFPEGIHEVYLRLSPDGKRIVYLTTACKNNKTPCFFCSQY